MNDFVILGGGPSLTQAQVNYVRNKATVIAVNDTYRLAPWADYLFYADWKWWKWWGDDVLKTFPGAILTLRENRQKHASFYYQPGPLEGLSEFPYISTGKNSGYMAINIAVQKGARRIILLGIDMKAQGKKTHWFGDHRQPTSLFQAEGKKMLHLYRDKMLPYFDTLREPLKEKGVEVINCSPDSDLEVFPKRILYDAI
jgi:hypothetical protein